MSESLDSKKFPTYCVALTQKQTHEIGYKNFSFCRDKPTTIYYKIGQ